MPATPPALSLLAHQGGWDEIAMIGVPVLIIAALLALAKRRVDAVADDGSTRDSGSTGRSRER